MQNQTNYSYITTATKWLLITATLVSIVSLASSKGLFDGILDNDSDIENACMELKGYLAQCHIFSQDWVTIDESMEVLSGCGTANCKSLGNVPAEKSTEFICGAARLTAKAIKMVTGNLESACGKDIADQVANLKP